MSSTLKMHLIIVEDDSDLFSTSLNIHISYDEKQEFLILPAFSDYISSSTQEPNNYIYQKFDLTVVRYETAYVVVAKVKKT